jgi:hypothetical protein
VAIPVQKIDDAFEQVELVLERPDALPSAPPGGRRVGELLGALDASQRRLATDQ